ncbi:subtilisin-like protein [Mycena alexandri]|uniref:Subtilisin-like protein n=1 Tax=Mycena alexandri TaxID=1745969 RepID=A0AAD6X153_9AGAR|nr:subtilisin-like protein [Mycena alexandri]
MGKVQGKYHLRVFQHAQDMPPRSFPAPNNFVLQGSLKSAPQGFANLGPAGESSLLNLRIALPSSNIAGLEKALLDVSNPSSSNHGNHLSRAQVKAFVAPTDEAAAAVNTWLASHGLGAKTVSHAGDWLSVSLNVSQANDMMAAKYENFQHIASGKIYARTLSFSLPAKVANFVAHVHPTISFNNPVGPVLSTPKPVSADDLPTPCSPACLQSLYEIPIIPATEKTNSIAVPGFLGEFANAADLTTFLKMYRPDMPSNATFTTQLLDGGSNPQNGTEAGREANLDIQYTVGLATGVPVSFVSIGADQPDGLHGFLDVINILSGEDDVPQVMTTSYLEDEEGMIAADLAFKLCEAYMAFGARGTSMLFGSGDAGVAGNGAFTCTTFLTTVPSGCPYVTSVSSTGGISPETASSFSGGGFSTLWGTPDYQADAVAAYLTLQGSANAGLFNTTGRGYPDVSAQGNDVPIIVDGQLGFIGGTSASTPTFASVIALLNDQLIAAGKPPLGFLNPWLYANPGMLNDVTSGSNPGCNTDGFAASTGWDPVTGLGTPNFPRMKAAAGL